MKHHGYKIKVHRDGNRTGFQAIAYKSYAATIVTEWFYGHGAKRRARHAAMELIDQRIAEGGRSGK